MSTQIWENAPHQDSQNYYKSEIATFNEKMLAVGFIDYTETNTSSIKNLANAWLSVYPTTIPSYRTMCTLYYKMPVGDSSIKFEDVVGENYKKIVSESYDSTACYIKIIFQTITHQHTGSTSNGSHCYPCARAYVSKKDSFLDAHEICPTISRYNTSISGGKTLYNLDSIIHLGADNAFISFLTVKHTSNVSTNKYFNNPIAIITLAINRKNGFINVFYPNGNNTGSTDINSESYVYPPNILNISDEGYYTITDTREMLQGGDVNFVPIDEDGELYLMHTYHNQNINLEVNNSVLRMANPHPPNFSIGFVDVLIKYKAEIIKGRYFNHGNISEYFRWGIAASSVSGNRTRSSYLFLMNEHPCTTESVAEE